MTSNKKIENNIYIHDKISNKYNKRHVEIYNIYEQKRLSKTIKNIVDLIDSKSKKVLDFWAWTGNLTHFFLENWCDVTALDISKNSLKTLSDTYCKYKDNLKTKVFDGKKIPFPDDSFNILATYSVLHHIPDYLGALVDMVRVVKKGGLLYIDHEANRNKRYPSKKLKHYYNKTNKLAQKTRKILGTWEIFEFDFWRGVFIRTLINKRFRNEWDIHVFKDDHIERDKVISILEKNGMKIIKEEDYLLYNKNIPIEEYNKIKDKINDTKYIVAKKV